MIEVNHVSKRYGDRVAVEDLTFTVQPGVVTGFLGPNGAGKSTTMRLILGLDRPSSGTATVAGRSYLDLRAPLHEVGAMLEARAIHTGRSARNHLLALAQTHGIPDRRVDEVIDIVGLTGVARKRVGSFSLGMGQRLGIAVALLGDPHTVILDEPANGLDPEGIRWIRTLLMELAREGRTVFLSSHLMSEIQQSAEHLIVIGRGRLIEDAPMADFVTRASADAPVRVRGPQLTALAEAILAAGAVSVEPEPEGDALRVQGLGAEQIGEAVAAERLVLYELTPLQVTLEEAFMSLTHDSIEYQPTGAAT
ncbi:MAG TPA: ABC transporter ATP-binding protein [Solirubrobacteraceae bacterium]|nr:ABC transporter ATP-binding protein [Solirubrobacteraceae bacterium]